MRPFLNLLVDPSMYKDKILLANFYIIDKDENLLFLLNNEKYFLL